MTAEKSARPYLRWAGSKRKLIKHLLPQIPKDYGCYHEPFLGSGALFFELSPDKAVISDVLPDLVDTYVAVRDNVEKVLEYLLEMSADKDTYYYIRENPSRGRFKKAAEFIYLNKNCWNGLYRVNLNGKFNVPFGRLKGDYNIDQRNLRECSKVLNKKDVTIRKIDFEVALDNVESGDFVFLDPPYVTAHNNNGFHEYNDRLFTWDDQVRLAKKAHDLVGLGAHVLVTNANHPDIIGLYRGFQSDEIFRHSTLASDTSARRRTSELVFVGHSGGKT